MAALQVKDNLYWVGALDPDLRVFDVIMETEYGTSYNAYVLKTAKGNILFETVKAKYFDRYIANVTEICPLDSIKYIVVNHTEPDHVGSVERILDYAPDAKVVGSQVALNFLTEICNKEIPGIAVADGDSIDLGDEVLSFHSVPFLHWPDSIYTYLESHKSLITCDSFGCHYADERVFNDKIEGKFVDAYKYYFDMIMGPFKSHVQYALNQIRPLSIECICPGHGPVLRENLNYYLDLYDRWSRELDPEKKEKPFVVNTFVSAYGYTEELAHEINKGIKEEVDVDIKLHDMVYANSQEVLAEIKSAEGILFGTPTINGDALPPVADLVGNLNGIVDGGKVAASYGSYGWSGEGPEMINARLNLLRMDTVEPPLRVQFKPSDENREAARKFGRRFGKKVKDQWEQLGSSSGGGKTFWKCTVCGEIFEGALPPLTCPVCGVGSDAFIEADVDVVNYESSEPLKAVIIGSSAAAVAAAEALRARNKSATIDLYTKENILPHYRPVLTEMISETIDDAQFYIKNDSFYTEKGINIHLNTGVASVHKEDKTVTLESGDVVSYDKLLLATGASPFVPPIKGKDLGNVFTVRNNRDLAGLKAALEECNGGKVTVVGGGLLGLEAACSLGKLDCEVTVIDTAPTILPRQTDKAGSEFLQRIIKKSQISIITDTVVNEIYGGEKVEGVVLANGTDIKSDIVLVSAGLMANEALAKSAGLTCNRAIVTNGMMETSDPHIYAAGDCAIANGVYYGIWEPALAQGRVAGSNMAGDSVEFAAKQYPATLNAFETSLLAIGNLHNRGEDEDNVQKIRAVDELRETYRTLYFTNGKLDGALLIGDLAGTAAIIAGVNKSMTLEESLDNKILK